MSLFLTKMLVLIRDIWVRLEAAPAFKSDNFILDSVRFLYCNNIDVKIFTKL